MHELTSPSISSKYSIFDVWRIPIICIKECFNEFTQFFCQIKFLLCVRTTLRWGWIKARDWTTLSTRFSSSAIFFLEDANCLRTGRALNKFFTQIVVPKNEKNSFNLGDMGKEGARCSYLTSSNLKEKPISFSCLLPTYSIKINFQPLKNNLNDEEGIKDKARLIGISSRTKLLWDFFMYVFQLCSRSRGLKII